MEHDRNLLAEATNTMARHMTLHSHGVNRVPNMECVYTLCSVDLTIGPYTTAQQMVVDQSAGLHPRIDNRRAAKFKAALFQIFAQLR